MGLKSLLLNSAFLFLGIKITSPCFQDLGMCPKSNDKLNTVLSQGSRDGAHACKAMGGIWSWPGAEKGLRVEIAFRISSSVMGGTDRGNCLRYESCRFCSSLWRVGVIFRGSMTNQEVSISWMASWAEKSSAPLESLIGWRKRVGRSRLRSLLFRKASPLEEQELANNFQSTDLASTILSLRRA